MALKGTESGAMACSTYWGACPFIDSTWGLQAFLPPRYPHRPAGALILLSFLLSRMTKYSLEPAVSGLEISAGEKILSTTTFNRREAGDIGHSTQPQPWWIVCFSFLSALLLRGHHNNPGLAVRCLVK